MPPPVLSTCSAVMLHLNRFNVLRRMPSCISTVLVRNSSNGPPSSSFPVNIKIDERTGLMEARKESIGMQRYRELAKDYADMIQKEELLFERGRRHLANMMGEDVETFTQKQIDEAIAYLLPSGLYERPARPVMKPLKELFSGMRAAQFDTSGRPISYLYYTGESGLYEVLHEGAGLLQALDEERDSRFANNLPISEEDALDIPPRFFAKDRMETQLGQKLSEEKFKLLMTLLDRLKDHPLSKKAEEFLSQFEVKVVAQVEKDTCEVETLEDGRRKITSPDCVRKWARGKVITYYPGKGNITINGTDINYFPRITAREQILYPLLISRMLGKVDIEATVKGSGEMAQAVALRYGISHTMVHIVDEDTQKILRAAGLLTFDPRTRERKKPGQEGARRKYTWLKR